MQDTEIDAWLAALKREAVWRAWAPYFLVIAAVYAILVVLWPWR